MASLNELRMYVRHLMRESLLKERYIRQVANKAATGEKYTEEDIINLFQMTVDSALGDNASADVVPVAWNNLKIGVADRSLIDLARSYIKRLSSLEKKRSEIEDWNVNIASPDYEKVEEKLMGIDSKISDLTGTLQKLARVLGKKHQAPGSRYGTTAIPEKISDVEIDPDMPKTVN